MAHQEAHRYPTRIDMNRLQGGKSRRRVIRKLTREFELAVETINGDNFRELSKLHTDWKLDRMAKVPAFRPYGEPENSGIDYAREIREEAEHHLYSASVSAFPFFVFTIREPKTSKLKAGFLHAVLKSEKSAYADRVFFAPDFYSYSPVRAIVLTLAEALHSTGIRHMYLGSWKNDPASPLFYKARLCAEALDYMDTKNTTKIWKPMRSFPG